MKKLLALVLALVMTLSLCITSNAVFADAADIEHTEAVNVLNALGVIAGKGDNKFDPKGNVTRAEMAKMITIVALGDVDVTAFQGTTTDLKDINGHWAEAYIKYCYSQGIIAGKGAGMFDPNANVTAVEAAKMLLVALGYNAKVQGYTGTDWAINVTRDAQLKGFYTKLSVASNAALTRDQAAQMIYNAIDATLIVETKTLNSDGTVSTHYSDDPYGDDLLDQTFDVDVEVGQMTKVSYNSDKGEYTYTVNGYTYKTTDDFTDLYGQNVKALDTEDSDGNQVVYGIFANKGGVVFSAPYVDVSLTKLDPDKVVKYNDVSYKTNGTSLSFLSFNYNATGTNAAPTGDAVAATCNFIDTDGDGDIDVVTYVPFTAKKVTYAGVKSFTLETTSNFKYEEQNEKFTLDGTVAKDAYVQVVAKANSFKNVDELVVLEKQTGKVTSLNGTTKVAVDGTWYKKDASTAVTLGKNLDFYAVNGYILSVSSATVATTKITDYALVTATQDAYGFTGNQVKVLYTDGTTAVLDVDQDADTRVTYSTIKTAVTTGTVSPYVAPAATLYLVEDSDNDDKYEFTAVEHVDNDNGANDADSKVGGFDGWTNSAYAKAVGKAGKIGGMNIADDAVIMVKDTANNKYKVITGAQLAKMNAATVVEAYYNESKTTGYGTVEFAYVTSALVSTSDLLYGYVTADVTTSKDDKDNDVDTVTFWDGAETKTLVTDKNNDGILAKGEYFQYKLDADGNMTQVTELTVDSDGFCVSAYDGTNLKLSNTDKTLAKACTIDEDDSVIIYVDSANTVGVDGGSVALCNTASSTTYVKNVVATYDTDGTIFVLFVDIANEIK